MGDVELVEAVRRGDRQAWADVYDRYGPRLLAFCTRLLNEPHTAADAVQDTFVVAAQRFDQLRDPSSLRAWLYAIARNECTRHGRARARAVPMEEPAVMSTPDHLDPGNQAAASDVAELLWAAAAGLDERDRILLELNVRHGLEGQELADAAGIKAGQISMATGRMRDRIERSLGALLVARRGRDDCPGLQAVLSEWDGSFTVLMRKRVARHIERCELCEEKRKVLVAPLGSMAALPFLVPPADLRDRVLDAISSVSGAGDPTNGSSASSTGLDLPALHETWPGGFPPLLAPRSDGRRKVLGLVLAAAAILLVVAAAVFAGGSGGDADAEVVAGPQATTSTTEGSGTTKASIVTSTAVASTTPDGSTPVVDTTADGPATPATTVPPKLVPDPGGQAGPQGTTAPPVQQPPPPPPAGVTTTTTAAPPPNQPPTVGSPTQVSNFRTPSCEPANSTRKVSVTAGDDRGLASVRLAWTSPQLGSGSKAMATAGGPWSATLGPFTDGGSLTYRVVVTDTDGIKRTSAPRTVEVEPCPG